MLRLFHQYFPVRKMIFIIGEGVFIFISLLIGFWFIRLISNSPPENMMVVKAFCATMLFQLSLYYNNLYNLKKFDKISGICYKTIKALGYTAAAMIIISVFLPQKNAYGVVVFLSIILSGSLIISWRIIYRYIIEHGYFSQKILLLGSADIKEKIKNEINIRSDCGYAITADIPEKSDNQKPFSNTQENTLSYRQLYDFGLDTGIKKIIVCIREKRNNFPGKELLQCRMAGIEIIEGDSFYEMLSGKVSVSSITPGWLIYSDGFNINKYQMFSKRVVDILVSIILIILYMPLMAAIAVLIKLDSKGPVIYAQKRLGRKKQPFYLYKFRSMVADAEKLTGPVWCLNNDSRVTRIGKWIRKLRMDELPQLWNVLRGEMSFVGPRPERSYFVEQLEKTIPYYNERFSVKPGITGWAQISYGYGASEQDALEKLNYDLFYIKNMSLLMDLMIIGRTVKIVLFGQGAR